jgi:glycosyltransferase involved in cell wall biosynthesis
MRLVIDLQSCQCGSKKVGIGRYSMGLVKAMAARPRHHEIWIALSGLLPSSIPELRHAFDGLVPPDRIQVFASLPRIDARSAGRARIGAAEFIREDFLHALRPDFVHILSLFEGFSEDVVTSVEQYFPGDKTAVTLHDLIPLVQSATYLSDSRHRDHYYRKIDNIKKAGLLLANSEFSRLEGIDLLGTPPDRVVNVSAATDTRFKPMIPDPERSARLLARYGISRQFLMYTASFDRRKNQSGLIEAFALLPRELRKDYQLVIVGNGSEEQIRNFNQLAKKSGLDRDEVVFPGHIADADLVALYNLCHLFVLPSFAEGFGLPALEAMSCGTATIGSNVTSIPEVIGWSEALFDPSSPPRIAAKIHQALTDAGFLQALRERGLEQAKKFSWDQSADKVLDAFEAHAKRNAASDVNPRKNSAVQAKNNFRATTDLEDAVKRILQLEDIATLDNEEYMEIAMAMASNREKVESIFSEK